MDAAERQQYEQWVETARACAVEVVELLRSVPTQQWDLPTDLPGWTVKSVASHIAHFEAGFAGFPLESAEVPDAPHLTSRTSRATEEGVIVRRDWTPEQIIDEIRYRTTSHHN